MRKTARQHRVEHLLCRGLSDAPRDADNGDAVRQKIGLGQTLQGLRRIGNEDVGRAVRERTVGQHCQRALLHGRRNEAMPIVDLSDDRYIERVRRGLAAVDHDGTDLLGQQRGIAEVFAGYCGNGLGKQKRDHWYFLMESETSLSQSVG